MEQDFHLDPSQMKLSKRIKNFQRSSIKNVVASSGLRACVEMVQWLIKHTNVDVKNIHNEQGRCIASFMPNEWVR